MDHTELEGYCEVCKDRSAATLLREVERRARFVVMMRENGLKHEPAWDELVKTLNELRAHDTANAQHHADAGRPIA